MPLRRLAMARSPHDSTQPIDLDEGLIEYKTMSIPITEHIWYQLSYGSHCPQEVYDRIPTANSIFVMTYNISKNGGLLLDLLRSAKPSARVRFITNIPGRFDSYFDSVARRAAKVAIRDYVTQLSPSRMSPNLEVYFLFSNHAKVIACDDLLYVGSANFSNESERNFEAGVLLRDAAQTERIIAHTWDHILPFLVPHPENSQEIPIKDFMFSFDVVDNCEVFRYGTDRIGAALPKAFQQMLLTVVRRLLTPAAFDEDLPPAINELVPVLAGREFLVDSEAKLQPPPDASTAQAATAPSDAQLRAIAKALSEQRDRMLAVLSPWVWPVVDNTPGTHS